MYEHTIAQWSDVSDEEEMVVEPARPVASIARENGPAERAPELGRRPPVKRTPPPSHR
ncbi:hypothetical protein [Prauserella alba]|uniref:hypothetical protein n=1 Tax=Prauserella alba TaxID=176898 RepID=UPI0020A3299A|nr:hypothetical protein [Prauserella alba]